MPTHQRDHQPVKHTPAESDRHAAHDGKVFAPPIIGYVSPGQIIQLQRLVGNQAVQRYIAQVQRQPHPPATTANVEFRQFLNSGTGITGKQLGEIFAAGYMMNAVELQFTINAAARRQYRNLVARQWAGPEVIWVKTGPPFEASWRPVAQGPGTGADDPDLSNVAQRGDIMAYYDSPGLNLLGHMQTRPSRIHVVQNFTGWIEGTPISGGSATRLCPVAAWHSVVSLADFNWDDRSTAPQYQRVAYNRSATGWQDTTSPPDI